MAGTRIDRIATLFCRLAGGFLLIVLIIPSSAFIFAVRKYLFAMWGFAKR
jgi:multiple sugar transport system permease protein